jgi:putative glutathione S-transferase
MFNEEFDEFVDEKYRGVSYYPKELRSEIDELNEWGASLCISYSVYLRLTRLVIVYNTVNNGVYKSGFAQTQEAYEENVFPLFKSLDRLEQLLEGRTFLVGPGKGTLTEADLRVCLQARLLINSAANERDAAVHHHHPF